MQYTHNIIQISPPAFITTSFSEKSILTEEQSHLLWGYVVQRNQTFWRKILTPSSGLKIRESREEPGVRIKLSSAYCMTVLFTVITVGTSDPTVLMYWQWYSTPRVTAFLDFVHHPAFWTEQNIRKPVLNSVRRWKFCKAPSGLGPLEGAILGLWPTEVIQLTLHKHLESSFVNGS